MSLFTFATVEPLGVSSDSRVLQTERVELTRDQVAQIGRPSYFESLIEIDHLAEVPILSRFMPSQTETSLLLHRDTKLVVATPKVHNPKAGWVPGAVMMEPFVVLWDYYKSVEWNQLLRGTSDIRVNGHSVFTISVSTDVTHYRSRYVQEILFRCGTSVFNVGYLHSSSIGPIIFEINEI